MIDTAQNIHGVDHGVKPSLNISLPRIQMFPLDKKHVFPPSPPFLEQKSLFCNVLISFIKSFKTLDFSKHVSQAMTLRRYDITLGNILK